jgi:putative aldouronate transport system permease protein
LTSLVQQVSKPTIKKRKNRLASKSGMQLFLMALPFVALIFVFSYLPLWGWVYSFFNFQISKSFFDIFSQKFVGLSFFSRMFSPGSMFMGSLINTLAMSGLALLVSPLPIIFALFLAEIRNSALSRTIQTITSLPNFISWILVYGFCFAMFSSQGVMNTILTNLHLINSPLNVLANAKIVWGFQTLLNLWKTIGWSAIIYIASLAGVDRELYDAAEVDGANRFGKMLHISVPGLMPTFIVLLILSVGNLVNVGFEQYFVFRNPIITEKIDVLDIYIYTQGLTNMEFSYATAVGMYKSLVSILLLFGVNAISKKAVGRSII